jgi:hypothetical protein
MVSALRRQRIDLTMETGANMNFSQANDQFEASAPGTDAFLGVKEQMRSLIASDPAHAAAYFLVQGFARSYVILHDDEDITVEFALAAKTQLLKYMRQIEAAIPHGEKSLLEAMNRIVVDYDASREPF